MTALLGPAPAAARLRGVLDGALAGLGAAVAGLAMVSALVLAGWAAPGIEPSGSAGTTVVEALRLAGIGWLAAHHVPLLVSDGVVAWLPLGLLIIPVMALFSAGRLVGRRCPITGARDAAALVVALSVPYTAVAAGVAALASTEGVRALHGVSAVVAGLLAVVAGSAGIWRATRRGLQPWQRLPGSLRAAITAGVAGLAALLGAGGLLTVAALAVHRDAVATLVTALDAGLIGSVLLVLLSAAYVPNVIAWAAAYAVGPGFAVGSGTSVSAAGVELGALPALPLLGALPSPGPAPTPSMLAFVAPVAAGIVVGRVMARRLPASGWAMLLWVLAAAGVAGLLMGLTAALSGGPVGGGRLAIIGPSPWQVAGATAVELSVVAVPTAWLAWRRSRRS